jgi:hypothetical protein
MAPLLNQGSNGVLLFVIVVFGGGWGEPCYHVTFFCHTVKPTMSGPTSFNRGGLLMVEMYSMGQDQVVSE